MFLIGFVGGAIVSYTYLEFLKEKKQTKKKVTFDPERGLKEEFFRKKRNLPIWILRK